MKRTRLFLVRHGQVEGHEEKRYNGQVNVPLTPLGREQSARVRDHMTSNPLDAVYSSDLDRSCYCAELIAEAHNLEIVTDAALRELHVGDWEGRTWAELCEAYPDDWQARLKDLVNFQVPGG
ncbi:MAG: histidine phosphatase family protein, partial [Desulfuromonadales bacterium]|nr:histidine phosphatase family protein [Desulfuromonadales bacterium]